MAKNNASNATLGNEDKWSAETHYKISPGKEKILRIKRRIVAVIENLLEENISAEQLIKSCRSLSRSDYADLIEERNILHLCGYPLCSNNTKPSSQTFHIVYKYNKVYDITERKCFCCNQCYNASCYLKEQLSEVPIWLRENPTEVKLLADEENSGNFGEAIVMDLNPSDVKMDEKEEKVENMDWFTDDDKNLIRDEMMSGVADRISNLNIQEYKNFSSAENDYDETGQSLSKSSQHVQGISKSVMDIDPDDSDENDDDDLVKEEKGLYEKLMPIRSKKINRPILIEPHSNVPTMKSSRSSAPISPQFIQNLLKEWVTDDTLSFLSNRTPNCNTFESKHCDIKECNRTSNPNVTDELERRLSSLNMEKMDKEDQDEKADSLSNDELIINPDVERIKSFFQGEDLRPKKREQKVVKFKVGKNIKLMDNKELKTDNKNKKRVSYKETGNEISPNSDPTSLEKLVLPKVDSLSQNALRQQVVCMQLKKAYVTILPFVGVHYRIVCTIFPELVSSFRLTATNVVFKPTEWKLIAIVVLRMMLRSNEVKAALPEPLADDTVFCTLLMKTGFSKDISLPEIDQILQKFV